MVNYLATVVFDYRYVLEITGRFLSVAAEGTPNDEQESQPAGSPVGAPVLLALASHHCIDIK